MKKGKQIPKFENEDEERDFWDSVDTSEYFPFEDFRPASTSDFPLLRTTTNSKGKMVKLSAKLVGRLKALADKKNTTYESLAEELLTEKVNELVRDK